MAFKLPRRAVLRGAAGVGVSLPFLECMFDRGSVSAQTGMAPTRYAVVFAGQSIGGDGWEKNRYQLNGERVTEEGHFVAPAEYGAGYTMTTPLESLASLRDDFSLVSNLRIPYSATSAEPADVPMGGAYRDFHGGASSPLLSGTRSDAASFRANGPTSDQLIADLHRGATTHASLVYRAQPSWYLSGSSYSGRQYISYGAAREPIEAQTSPQIAFDALFGGFMPDDMGAAARLDFERRARRSVLDLVLGKRDRLLMKLGRADRMRLERHFDELRNLEMRIAAIPPVASGTCVVPSEPGVDPAVGGDNTGAGADDIRAGAGYSGETERARVFADLIHMAFVCDLTRVATLQLTVFQSHMSVLDVTTSMGTPIRADLHEVGHNGDPNNRGQLPVSMMLGWHLGHYAYLLDRLKNTEEGDGTVLDNSVIVFMPEGGHGRQLNDATTENQTHSTENMVLAVAGGGGGLAQGRHIDGGGAHPAQVLVSAMQAAGRESDTFGDVTGTLPSLFG